MRKTRSRNKHHVKRYTRRVGGENSPNPAAGAPVKVNKKPTINLSSLPSKNYRISGQIPVNPLSNTNGSFFPPGNEGFAFPAAPAAVNNRVEKIKARAKLIRGQRKGIEREIEREKERKAEKRDLEEGIQRLKESIASLKAEFAEAKKRKDKYEMERIDEYIDSLSANVSSMRNELSRLESNNENNENEY